MEIKSYDRETRAYKLCLYDRLIFNSELTTKTYINVYPDQFIPSNTPDITADAIFERTINPNLNPRIYVCIKVGNEYREDLKKKGE